MLPRRSHLSHPPLAHALTPAPAAGAAPSHPAGGRPARQLPGPGGVPRGAAFQQPAATSAVQDASERDAAGDWPAVRRHPGAGCNGERGDWSGLVWSGWAGRASSTCLARGPGTLHSCGQATLHPSTKQQVLCHSSSGSSAAQAHGQASRAGSFLSAHSFETGNGHESIVLSLCAFAGGDAGRARVCERG